MVEAQEPAQALPRNVPRLDRPEASRDQLLAADSSRIENNGTGTCDGP
jgi:hypothetical protein